MSRSLLSSLLCVCILSLGTGSSSAADSSRLVGVWNVRIDPLTEFLRSFREILRRAPQAPLMDGIAFDISRPQRALVTDQTKHALTSRWQRVLAEQLESDAFEDASDDELQEKLGMTRAQMLDKMVSGQPFGQRRNVQQHTASDLHVLVRDDADACGGSIGGLFALVLGWYSDPGVQSDYGSVSVLIFGLGDCGSQSSRARTYLAREKRALTDALYEALENSE